MSPSQKMYLIVPAVAVMSALLYGLYRMIRDIIRIPLPVWKAGLTNKAMWKDAGKFMGVGMMFVGWVFGLQFVFPQGPESRQAPGTGSLQMPYAPKIEGTVSKMKDRTYQIHVRGDGIQGWGGIIEVELDRPIEKVTEKEGANVMGGWMGQLLPPQGGERSRPEPEGRLQPHPEPRLHPEPEERLQPMPALGPPAG